MPELFRVDGNTSEKVGQYSTWRVMQGDKVIGTVFGPCSLLIVGAAVAALNQGFTSTQAHNLVWQQNKEFQGHACKGCGIDLGKEKANRLEGGEVCNACLDAYIQKRNEEYWKAEVDTF